MKIHTYYRPIQSIGVKPQQEILKLWVENWSKHGFEPVVINQQNAEAHPLFMEYHAHLSLFPMMVSLEYDLACFFRWLAMAYVGGGLMADYDCFNNGFTPEDISDSKILTVYCPPHVPCLVSGPALEYERVVREIFMRFKPSDYKDWLKKHTRNGTAIQDMLVLANHSDQIEGKDIVREFSYKSEDWKKAKAIHFCHAGTNCRQLECIKQWLQT